MTMKGISRTKQSRQQETNLDMNEILGSRFVCQLRLSESCAMFIASSASCKENNLTPIADLRTETNRPGKLER